MFILCPCLRDPLIWSETLQSLPHGGHSLSHDQHIKGRDWRIQESIVASPPKTLSLPPLWIMHGALQHHFLFPFFADRWMISKWYPGWSSLDWMVPLKPLTSPDYHTFDESWTKLFFSWDQMYSCHVCCSYWQDFFSPPINLHHLWLSRNAWHYFNCSARIPSPRLSPWYILVMKISQKEIFEAIFLSLSEMSWFMAQFSDHIPIRFQDFFSYSFKIST